MSVHPVIVNGKKRWKVRWRDDGRGSQQRSKTFDRKADADALDREIARRKQTGEVIPVAVGRERVGDLLMDWWRRDSLQWAKSTRVHRMRALDTWIDPYFRNTPLRMVTRTAIKDWRADLVESGVTNDSANRAVSIMSAFMGALVKDGKLDRNPCEGLRKLPVVPSRRKAISPIEVERLRLELPSLRDVVLVSLMAYAGLRPGEALAVAVGNISDNVILVDRNWTYGELKLVKTGRERTVEVVAPLRDDLRLFLPRIATADELACPNDLGGYVDLHNWRRRVFQPACKRAGVDVTPYELRHTYCSLLAHEGQSPVYIAAAMGHSLIETQSRYSHIIEDARLSPRKPMVEAIYEARAELAEAGASSVCLSDPPAVLRRAVGSEETA
jgi:integrase